MSQKIDSEPTPSYWFLIITIVVAAIASARWFYSGRTESHHLWTAIGFLLFTPRAYAFRGYRPGAKLPLWTGVLCAIGLMAMLHGLVLRLT